MNQWWKDFKTGFHDQHILLMGFLKRLFLRVTDFIFTKVLRMQRLQICQVQGNCKKYYNAYIWFDIYSHIEISVTVNQ